MSEQGYHRFGTFEYVRFICDNQRHLICDPYSIVNLHRMAEALGIKRCWFHRGATYPHYDIPLKRIDEIMAKCRVVEHRELIRIIKQQLP